MNVTDLKKCIGIGSFGERWPDLAETIRKGQEAKRRALSGPSIAEAYQAEMAQVTANIQKQVQRIQEQAQTIFFDEKE